MRTQSRLFLIAALLFTTSCAMTPSSQTPPTPLSKPTPSDLPQIEFERYTLPNGLEVILHRDNSVPLVAVNVWYHVGSGDESSSRTGFAHLFEHMMFQGSKHVGRDAHFSTLRNIGATSINGTTNKDRTNYYELVPSNHIETALWLESDRMGYMLDVLTQESLDNQRDVVRNERRQNYDTVPYGADRFAVAAALYPEGHPYRYLTIGRHEDIEAATLDDIRDFFKTHYTPSNATLTLAGDFDTDQAKALVQKWFGSFPTLPKPPKTRVPTPKLPSTVHTTIEDPFAKLPRIHYAFHSPPYLQPGDNELDILSLALGARGWGRLYQRLVLDEHIAQRVSVYQASSGLSSVFHVILTLRPDQDPKRAETVLQDALLEATTKPLSQREVTRAINILESRFIWGLESLMNRANRLQSFNHFRQDPGYLTTYLTQQRAHTPDDILRAAQHTLNAPHARIITLPKTP